MRIVILILGIVALVFGLFWAAQGYGLVQWPPHAPGQFTMVGDMHWVYYGLVVAFVGLLAIIYSSGRRRRA